MTFGIEGVIFQNPMSEKANDIGKKFERLVEIVRLLRAPEGCPWDREQTHLSLRPCLIEETYELVESIEKTDFAGMKEELGDILLHVLFHADIQHEKDGFNIGEVIDKISEKLIRRHPHVFADVEVNGTDEVLHNWENIKLSERKCENENASLLDGIPKSMPALLVAQRMQEKAARIGFDWTEVKDVLSKVEEEIGEIKETVAHGDSDRIEDEIGDLLFALTNLARFQKLNAEMALRRTNEKFSRRFRHIEEKIREDKIENPTLKIMDEYWEEAKRNEK